MAERLTREQQKQYREELEYQEAHRKPSTYEKVKSAVGTAAQVARDIGQNPHVQQIRRQDGFAGPVSAAPRSATSRQQYQGAPVDPNSMMHPGNRIVVMRCNDTTGQCKTIATANEATRQRQPRQPRQRRPAGAVGGLGGNDPGFF